MKAVCLLLLSLVCVLSAVADDRVSARQKQLKVEQLKSSDWIMQMEAIELLSRWQHKPAVTELVSLIKRSKNDWLKGQALIGIARIDQPQAKGYIAQFSSSSSVLLRRYAFEALALTADKADLAKAKTALKDKDAAVQYAAFSAYAAIEGKAAWPALKAQLSKVKLTKDSAYNAVKAAVQVNLPEANKMIRDLYKTYNGNSSERREFIRGLTEIRRKDNINTVVYISAHFNDSEQEQQMCLAFLRDFDVSEVEAGITTALKTTEKHATIRTSWLASKLCPSADMGKAVAGVLNKGDLDNHLITEGLRALSNTKMVPGNHEALFVKYLMHKDSGIRKMAIRCLTLCPNADLFEIYRPLINSDSSTLKHDCLEALMRSTVKLKHPKEGVAAYLKSALEAKESHVVKTAVDCIGKFGQPEDLQPAIALFKSTLTGKDDKKRLEIAKALGQVCDDNNVRELTNAQGYISDWMVIGTFLMPKNNNGYKQEYPPEKEVDFTKKYKAQYEWERFEHRRTSKQNKFERDVQWRFFSVNEYNGVLAPSMVTPPPHNNVIAYCVSDIDVPKAQKITFDINADDALVLWVNGKRLLDLAKPYSNRRGQWEIQPSNKKVVVDLKAGKNRIMVKSANYMQYWGFSIRCLTDQGTAVSFKSNFKQPDNKGENE